MPKGWFGEPKRHSKASKLGWHRRKTGLPPLYYENLLAQHKQRSRRARLRDERLRAKDTIEKQGVYEGEDSYFTHSWAKDPGRKDIEGIDTSVTIKTKAKEEEKRIDLEHEKWKKRKKELSLESKKIIEDYEKEIEDAKDEWELNSAKKVFDQRIHAFAVTKETKFVQKEMKRLEKERGVKRKYDKKMEEFIGKKSYEEQLKEWKVKGTSWHKSTIFVVGDDITSLHQNPYSMDDKRPRKFNGRWYYNKDGMEWKRLTSWDWGTDLDELYATKEDYIRVAKLLYNESAKFSDGSKPTFVVVRSGKGWAIWSNEDDVQSNINTNRSIQRKRLQAIERKKFHKTEEQIRMPREKRQRAWDSYTLKMLKDGNTSDINKLAEKNEFVKHSLEKFEKQGLVTESEVSGMKFFKRPEKDSQRYKTLKRKVESIIEDKRIITEKQLWDKIKKRDDMAIDWQTLTEINRDIAQEGKMFQVKDTSYRYAGRYEGIKFQWEGSEGVRRIKELERMLHTAKEIEDLEKVFDATKKPQMEMHSSEFRKIYDERYEYLKRRNNLETMEQLFVTPDERMIADKFIKKYVDGRSWEEVDVDATLGYILDDAHIIAIGKRTLVDEKYHKDYIDITPEQKFRRKDLGDLKGLAFGSYNAKEVWELYSLLGKKDVKFRVHKDQPYPLEMQKGDLKVYIAPRLIEGEEDNKGYLKRLEKVKAGNLESADKEED